MENGLHNGMRTNHDRDTWTNGGSNVMVKYERAHDKGKEAAMDIVNGGDMMDVDSEQDGAPGNAMVIANHTKMDELPDEIQHITADTLSLGLIVSRLAQFTHSKLLDVIQALASKPLPPNAVNGSSNYQLTGAEDTSSESLDKKVLLLKEAQDLHTRWVKTLVITEWSKKADKVSKLIDIRAHLASKLEEFNLVMYHMIQAKQDMHWAKVPSPDLKTALEVLSSGDVAWAPELGYLEPPPLTPQDKLDWIENVDTLLSVRLNLEEFDKIPAAFRDYTVDSGRVRFRVKGEFEVELTIGDEDPEKQFWFIDFRFIFTPAPAELPDHMRTILEAKVNHLLGTDGLAGCYKYLHEFVLTQKITEFWRQAVELSRFKWTETLSVERLNRSVAVQYWTGRTPSQGLKSWIIIAVDSRVGADGLPDASKPSCLVLKWFRDNKEVKGFDIPFDTETISAENLLRAVIARHVEYFLGSIYTKLSAKPRFAQGHTKLALDISKDEPSESQLTLQLFDNESVQVRVDGMTGTFTMLPPSQVSQEGQRKLNLSPNPAEDGPAILESLRWYYAGKDLSSRARSLGWSMVRSAISMDELKAMVQSASHSKETFQPIWLKRVGWSPQWFVIMTMSLGGDRWWLVELGPQKPSFGMQGPRMKMFSEIPMTSNQLSVSDDFFQNLTTYTSAIISHVIDVRELDSKHLQHSSSPSLDDTLPPQVKLPTIFVRLSDMLRPIDESKRHVPPTPWANEFIPIVFKGVQSPSEDQLIEEPSQPRRIKTTAEAQLAVTNRARLRLQAAMKGHAVIDPDIAYDSRVGHFTIRLRADVGTPMVALLAARVRSLERLVDFVGSILRAGKDLEAQSVTLRKIVFTYRTGGSDRPGATLPNAPRQDTRAWQVRLSLAQDKSVEVGLEPSNPHMRVIDFLNQAANSNELESLPSWLVTTLPLFRAVTRIENAWSSIAANGEGSFSVYPRGLNWLSLRFVIFPGLRRELNLAVRPRTRKGNTVWYISRDSNVTGRVDEFDRVLHQKVWTARGEGIKGLSQRAVADTGAGIEKLLELIDHAIRPLAGSPAPPSAPKPAPGTIQDTPSGAPAGAMPPQHQAPQSMQQAAQAQAQARLAQAQSLRQQAQANMQNQMHQRGGTGKGSSNSPVVVLD
ncbi:mediator of RNA polymerase II transcription subunit 14 [Echria macrotheca]|uniref:Mediator of RNA polymerase II transcription subunit 14 n=1 Tax=Echria macrotheca TaxID=438768 RepID=A0AAJ0B8H5_9PEZI|nr:mediator of RNA polymerase II transcription subunit 14 [Echria macrotheca]